MTLLTTMMLAAAIGLLGWDLLDKRAEGKKPADGLERISDIAARLSATMRHRTQVLTAILLLVALIGTLWLRSNQERIDDIVAARVAGRQAVCSLGEGIINSFISSSRPPASEDERERLQAKIDAFKIDLEKRVEVLGCRFDFLPAGNVTAPTTPAPGG